MKIVIIIILLMVLINYHSDEQIKLLNETCVKKNIYTDDYRTGDIIMFSYQCPGYYYGNNGINTDLTFIKNTVLSILKNYYDNYTHCGIIIKIDKPYVLHMISEPNFDNYNKKYVLGSLSLSSLDEIQNYRGIVHKYNYVGRELHNIQNVLENLYKLNLILDSNIFSIIFYRFYRYNGRKKLCCDIIKLVLSYYYTDIEKKNWNLNDVIKIINSGLYNKNPILLKNMWYNSVRS